MNYYPTLAAMLAVSSCAAPQFNYRWYGIDPAAGKLLGPVESMDLPLSTCQGDEQQKGKCAVLFIDEFDRLRNDLIQLKLRLDQCEKTK